MEREQRERQLLGEMRIVFGATRQHISAVKRQTGISAATLWALDEIARHPGISSGELAHRLCVHPTTASNLCRRLKSAGLIRNQVDTHDRRVVQLHPSNTGRKLVARAPEPKSGVLPTAIRALDDSTLDAAISALSALRDCVTQLGYSDDPMQPVAKR